MRILVINPGSTSTKIAVYENERELMRCNISHSPEELSQFNDILDQYDYRKQLVIDECKKRDIAMNFKAIVARGGLAKPIEGGCYEINEQMLEDNRHPMHKHACNMGCMIADAIAKTIPGCRSFIADPAVVDEMCDEARVCGSPLIHRVSIWHALNQKAIARRYAKSVGKTYGDLNLIICHLGGGISVAAHEHGRAVDVNNCLDGEGPFSPERAGTLPAIDVIRLCFSGKYTQEELLKMIAGKGGLTALLDTNDMRVLDKRIEDGDEHVRLIVDAMIYHVAKAMAAQAAVLKGKVDAIILTGGIAHDKYVVDGLKERTAWIAPVQVYPGEDELLALAQNAHDAMTGKVEAKVYA